MRYRVLALLTVATGVVAYAWRGQSWFVDSYAANLSGTFLGTMILLFFVERTIEQQRERERRRMEQIGLEQARFHLAHLALLFANMIKASAPSKLAPPATTRMVFSQQNLDHLDYLDLNALAGTLPDRSWKSQLEGELKRITDCLSEVVDKFIAFFNPDFVEHVEAVCASLSAYPEKPQSHWRRGS